MIPLQRVEPTDPYRETPTGYTYGEIATELGESIGSIQKLEREALVKCLMWCYDNGYKLEDLIDVRKPR